MWKGLIERAIRRTQRVTGRGHGVILTLHSVVSRDTLKKRLVSNPTLEITPEYLERTIRHYKRRGFHFLSLDEVVETVLNRVPRRPFVCVTFDDGYRNNLKVAAPILEKYGVPWTLYTITGFPDRAMPHYGVAIQDWIQSNDKVDFRLSGQNHVLPCTTLEEKLDAVRQVNHLLAKHLRPTEYQAFFDGHGVDTKRYTLSWEELSELAASDNVTIGSHTVAHPRLTTLGTSELRRELSVSKRRLEERLGCSVDHFSFPFGAWGQREVEMVRWVGYRSATTVQPRWVDVKSASLHLLPRVRLVENRPDLWP